MSTPTTDNFDQHELNKFKALAKDWWDPHGSMQALHHINPLRLQFIQQHTHLNGEKVVDIGCGGGILTESLAAGGATVTGIDLAAELIQVAQHHAAAQQLPIDYQCTGAEDFASQHSEQFDAVTCMELLEHVPDPGSIIQACSRLVKPGGSLFFATINRNPKSFLYAIIGAEYLLKMLPRGTHEYAKFIKPSELDRWARQTGLQCKHLMGIHYNPLTKHYSLRQGVDVNYLAHYCKP